MGGRREFLSKHGPKRLIIDDQYSIITLRGPNREIWLREGRSGGEMAMWQRASMPAEGLLEPPGSALGGDLGVDE